MEEEARFEARLFNSRYEVSGLSPTADTDTFAGILVTSRERAGV